MGIKMDRESSRLTEHHAAKNGSSALGLSIAFQQCMCSCYTVISFTSQCQILVSTVTGLLVDSSKYISKVQVTGKFLQGSIKIVVCYNNKTEVCTGLQAVLSMKNITCVTLALYYS